MNHLYYLSSADLHRYVLHPSYVLVLHCFCLMIRLIPHAKKELASYYSYCITMLFHEIYLLISTLPLNQAPSGHNQPRVYKICPNQLLFHLIQTIHLDSSCIVYIESHKDTIFLVNVPVCSFIRTPFT